MSDTDRILDRLAGMIHNHPKIEYLRISRRDAELLIAEHKAKQQS